MSAELKAREMASGLLQELADLFERDAMQIRDTALEAACGAIVDHEVSGSDDDILHLRCEAARMRRDAEEQGSGVFPRTVPVDNPRLDDADADTEIWSFEALRRVVGG